MSKEHSLIVAGNAALIRTATGELLPDSVLRVEKFDEKLSLLTVVLLKSDKTSLVMAQKYPNNYWQKIQTLISPFVSTSLSDLNCKVQFYKLLDSYKYMLTNLIDWPPQSLQRLWPFFTMFHLFPDLTPFCPNIIELRVKYDTFQKSPINWVTGCDLIAYRNSHVPIISSAVPIATICTPRVLNCGGEGDGDKGNRSSPQSNSEPMEGDNGWEPCKCDNFPSFDVKSIVNDIVSKMSLSTSKTSEEITNQSTGSQSCDSLTTEASKSLSQSSTEETATEAGSSFEDQKSIVETIAYQMKINEIFLNFHKQKFWAKVAEGVASRMKTIPFDIESVFKQLVKKYMDILEHRREFYCDPTYVEIMWPLFPYIHAMDISHFLPSFQIEKYKLAKEEFH